MTTQKYRILIDSQTSTNGVMVEADDHAISEDGWMLFYRNGREVAAIPKERIMAVLTADDDGKFAQCVANNEVEHLSNGVNYAHWRLDKIEPVLTEILADQLCGETEIE